MGGSAALVDATDDEHEVPARRPRDLPARALSRALLALPVVLFLVLGWSRRFLADDAFINFRVVRQFLAGNGPVFNVGERVETTTSTLWAATLVVGDLVSPLSLEWTSVVLALAFGALGLAAGMAGAVRLAGPAEPRSGPDDDGADTGPAGTGPAGAGRGVWVPVGALAYLGVAASWDWATGGLETGLSLAWLGGSFWAAVRVLEAPPSRRRLWASAFLVGLGVLVRPDFAPYVAGLGVPVAVAAWRRGRGRAVAATLLAAGLLPAALQLFRMGYYGRLFPNTLYAKEGMGTWWGQGLRYVENFLGPYLLVLPLVLVVALIAGQWRSVGSSGSRSGREWRLVVGGLLAGVALHILGIVRVGGDYMHARLLLTDWFALLLPLFCVRLAAPSLAALRGRRPALLTLAPLALLAWTAVAAVVARPPTTEFWTIDESGDRQEIRVEGVVDGRQQALVFATNRNPVDVDDERRTWGAGVAPGHYVDQTTLGPVPAGLDGRAIVGVFALGRTGYRLPLDVWVYDRHGLSDPVVARVRLEDRGVPGHEKALSPTWVAAQWLDPETEVDPETFALVPRFTEWYLSVDARSPTDPSGFEAERVEAAAALSCGDMDDLIDTAREPLTVSRFFGNVVDSVRLHGFRFAAEPAEAHAELCG